jgi:hypothetical protein
MVKHPLMSAAEIETAQKRCFREDLRRLGPSIYRSLETWILGYERLKDSTSSLLRQKADSFAREIRKGYPVFLAGKTLAPGRDIRRWIGELESRIHRALGPPTFAERVRSCIALALAAWTGLSLKLGLFQHPPLTRHTFRMPEESLPSRVWRRLRSLDAAGHRVEVELRPEATVWVTVAGRLNLAGADRLAAGLRDGLKRRREHLVLDLERVAQAEHEALERLAERLREFRSRIRVVHPPTREFATLAALFAIYR